MKPFTITTAFWQDVPPTLHLLIPETDETRGRRWRAKQVLQDYEYRLTNDGVIFRQNLRVLLLPDRVGCTCQDIKNRQLPCKHIFAAASLRGDAAAVLSSQPVLENPRSRADQPHRKRTRVRPQDVRVGRYFLLSDFLFSDTALKEGIPNWLDCNSEYGAEVLECMAILCQKLLDPICEEFGRISVTRGYLGQQVYARLYAKDAENWIAGALAHGFQETGGADIWVHRWEGSALELAKYLQFHPEHYQFDFIRTYPESSILCVGVGRFKNRRTITEWLPNFTGSNTHRPTN